MTATTPHSSSPTPQLWAGKVWPQTILLENGETWHLSFCKKVQMNVLKISTWTPKKKWWFSLCLSRQLCSAEQRRQILPTAPCFRTCSMVFFLTAQGQESLLALVLSLHPDEYSGKHLLPLAPSSWNMLSNCSPDHNVRPYETSYLKTTQHTIISSIGPAWLKATSKAVSSIYFAASIPPFPNITAEGAQL